MNENSCCPTLSPALGIVRVLDFGNSNGNIVVSQFNLHFPGGTLGGTFFHLFICHLYIFFGEGSVKVFGSFFFFLISWDSAAGRTCKALHPSGVGFKERLRSVGLWKASCLTLGQRQHWGKPALQVSPVECLASPLLLSCPFMDSPWKCIHLFYINPWALLPVLLVLVFFKFYLWLLKTWCFSPKDLVSSDGIAWCLSGWCLCKAGVCVSMHL